jgi:hypothetical protein
MSIVGTSSQNPRFSPDSLPGLALWLDAADATTLTLSGSNVTQWRDKSGLGNTTTAIGGSPTYSSNQINLNGSSTYLSGPYVNTTTTLTAFVVATVNFSLGNYGEYYRLLSVGTTAAPDYNAAAYAAVIIHQPNSTNIGGYRNGAQNYVSVTTNTRFLLVQQYNGSTGQLYLNGSTNTSVGSSGSFSTSSYSIGRDVGNEGGALYSYWPGSISEVLLFNVSLTQLERQQVEGYLARKWGIAELTGDPYRFGGPRIVPTQISGCSLWLDGADPAGTGSPPSVGTSVSTWVDKSGNARNAISEGTSIPTFSNRGITYNGSGLYRTSYSAVLPAETLFVVFRWASISSGAPAFIGGTQWFQRLVYVEPSESRWLYFGGIASWGRWNTSPLSSNVDYMFGVTWNSSSVIMHLNGSPLATAGGVGNIASFSGSPTDSLIGGGGFNGTMYEMIGYNTVLTTAQRQLVEGYLATKWGLQASFPAPVAIGPYAGPIIPARAFSPLDVDGLSMWLDAADATTLSLSGSNVTQWRDKSGQGYTMAVPSGGYTSPTYSNGVLTTTGSNALWSTSNFEISGNTPVTLFLVGSITSSADIGPGATIGLAVGDAGARQSFGVITYQDSTRTFLFAPTTIEPDVFQILTPNISGQRYLLCGFYTGSVIQGTYNGTLMSSQSTTLNLASRPFQIGMRNANTGTSSAGTVCECLCYRGALSTSHRQQVENYLADKWGLRATMGGAHPSRYSPSSILPTQISGCLVWLDAADSATFTLSGSNVTQWRDKSGNANHFSTLAGTSPTYSSNEVAFPSGGVMRSSASIALTLNTYAVIVFKLMQPSDFSYVLSFTSMSPGGFTGHYSIRTNGGILCGTAASPGNEADFGNANYFVNGTFNPSFGASTYSNTPVVVAAKNTNLTGTTTVELSASVGRYFVGRMYEVILYSSPPTTTQRQQLEGYLAWKWGIQASLPGSVTPFANLKRALTPVFAPNQIPGCAMWLDAADATTLTLSGSNVTAWADKSGNGRNAVGTSSNPTYNATGFNSRPTVTFSNNLLTSSGWSLAPNRQFAWFVVVHLTSLANIWQRILISASVGYMNGYLGTLSNTSNILGIAGSTTISAPIATGTLSPQLVTYLFGTSELSSNTSAVSVNGGTFSTLGGNAGDIGTNGVIIGTDTGMGMGDRFLGHLSEVICYNSDVTQSQRRRIEGYLAHKWGLLGNLGGVYHPYRFVSFTIVPTQISGCAFWLDATDSTSMTLSGSNVTQWRDKSSNAYAGTAVNSPILQSNSINGLSAVQFNGSSQYVTFGNVLNLGTSHVHVFAVTRFTGDGAIVGKTSFRAFFGRWGLYRNAGDGGLAWYADATPAAGNNTTFADTTTTTQLLRGSWDRSTVSITQNGTLRSSNTFVNTSNLSNTDNLLVAAYGNSDGTGVQPGFFLNGVIGEILVYLGTMTTVQRQQVEGYLAWKWGIQSNLPFSTHAYTTFKP